MWSVYVLYSAVRKKSYVGYSQDVKKRLAEHNAGCVVSTKSGCPWQLIAEEKFETSLEARRKEAFLKTTTGRRRLAKMFQSNVLTHPPID